MLRLLCIALLSALVSADTPYENCGGATQVVTVQLDECTTSPCVLYKGQTVVGKVVLIPDRSSAAPTVDIIWVLLGYDVKVNEYDCSTLTPTPCPLVAGVEKTIDFTVYTPTYLPDMILPVKVKLLDDQGQLMTCIKVVVKIE